MFLFQENQIIAHRNNNLNEYYESLRNNVITLLEHVRIPNGSGASAADGVIPSAADGVPHKMCNFPHPPPPLPPLPPPPPPIQTLSTDKAISIHQQQHIHHPHTEHFDSYLSKLQSLCQSDGYNNGCTEENRPIYESVKSALQDFTVLPTAI